MTRRSAVLSAGVMLLLAGLAVLGSSNLGLTAALTLFGLAAGTALQSTLQNYLAGAILHSEGLIRAGTRVTIAGPNGAISGVVLAREPRLTVLRADGGTLIPVPNTVLVSTVVLIDN